MLNLFFQYVYFANYGQILIESIACVIFVYFLAGLTYKYFIDKADEVQRLKTALSFLVSILIAFGISLLIMFAVAYIGWFVVFFQFLTKVYFNFALMVTILFPLFKMFLARFSRNESFLSSPENKKSFTRRFLFLLLLSWTAFLMFLIFDLFGIPMGELIPLDPLNPNFDPFLLGFEWTFVMLIIDIIITRLVISIISIDKRPPKNALKSSTLAAAISAFVLWSFQLLIFEIILSRVLKITLFEQDIRVLAIGVSLLYFLSLYGFLRFKYLPKAMEADKGLIQSTDALVIKESNVILNVEDLRTYFYTEEGVVHAVEGVSFKINEGEVLGLVGETGCGKSVTALSILQLIQSPGEILSGKVEFRGEDLLKVSTTEMLAYRGDKITMIFQDPLNSLNPVFTVGKQISEVYLLHKKKELLIEASKHKNRSTFGVAREWSKQLLKDLNIPSPENIIDRYPHELSGGMRQRIQIAMGIAGSPMLLIADEPTTALDVTVQNQILKLLKDLKKKYNTSILFITHDLGVISKMCDRVAVMYTGSIVEYGSTKQIFTNPYHPYTKGLLSAVPIEGEEKELLIIPGMVPNLIYPPSGCRFHPRCPKRFQPCDSELPISIEVAPNYFVNCHLYDPKFNKTEEVSTS